MIVYFRYKMIEREGRISSGLLRLPYDNEGSVVAYLERDGNTVLYVKKVHRVFGYLLELVTSGTRKRASRKEIAEFLSNLSIMLKSGVPLVQGLKDLTEEIENPALSAAAEGILFEIEAGSRFSEAVSHFDKIFSSTVLYLIRFGEESGTLEYTLKDAAEHVKRIDEIISDTKQALLYPAFIFVTMGAAIFFWFSYVVPKIVGLFKEMDVVLPPLTLALLMISEFLQNYFGLLVGGLVMLVAILVPAIRNHQPTRYRYHQFLLHLPLIKRIISLSNNAYISEYLRLLLNAGVDTFRSFDILGAGIENEVYRKKLHTIRDELSNGISVANSFRAAEIFPPFIVRMVGIGEQSGTMPEQLGYVAEEYRSQLRLLVATIGKVIEPVVLIVAGLMFAIILGGIFLPIYDLIGKIS